MNRREARWLLVSKAPGWVDAEGWTHRYLLKSIAHERERKYWIESDLDRTDILILSNDSREEEDTGGFNRLFIIQDKLIYYEDRCDSLLMLSRWNRRRGKGNVIENETWKRPVEARREEIVDEGTVLFPSNANSDVHIWILCQSPLSKQVGCCSSSDWVQCISSSFTNEYASFSRPSQERATHWYIFLTSALHSLASADRCMPRTRDTKRLKADGFQLTWCFFSSEPSDTNNANNYKTIIVSLGKNHQG